MALVIAPVSLPWPLFVVALSFTLAAMALMVKEHGRRLGGGLATAFLLATFAIVISDEICRVFPFLIECWCPWCF